MRTTLLLKSIAVIAVFFIKVTAQALTIADYQKDFKSSAPTEGWAYQWNPTGVSLGDSAGYEDLYKTPGAHTYTVDPQKSKSGDLVDSNGSWLKLSKTTMLPGAPESKSTDQISHYIIVAYTVQPGEDGDARIVNSQIKRVLTNANEKPPSPISIYVNDVLIGSDFVKGYEPFAFDVPLGLLKAGDVVRVAYGCPADSYPATASLQFQIEVAQ